MLVKYVSSRTLLLVPRLTSPTPFRVTEKLWSVRLKRRLQPAVTRKLFQRFPCKGTTYEYADLVFRSMAGYQLVGSGSIPEVRSTISLMVHVTKELGLPFAAAFIGALVYRQGRRPFTAKSGVRFPGALPSIISQNKSVQGPVPYSWRPPVGLIHILILTWNSVSSSLTEDSWKGLSR